MSKLNFMSVCALAAIAFSFGAHANELLVSRAVGKSAGVFGLDLVVQSEAVGFEVRIDVPKGAKIDTSSCMKGISGLDIGACVFNGDQVVILALTQGLKPFTPGVLNLGEIRVSGASDELKVAEFLVSDRHGNPLAAKVTSVLDESAPSLQRPQNAR